MLNSLSTLATFKIGNFQFWQLSFHQFYLSSLYQFHFIKIYQIKKKKSKISNITQNQQHQKHQLQIPVVWILRSKSKFVQNSFRIYLIPLWHAWVLVPPWEEKCQTLCIVLVQCKNFVQELRKNFTSKLIFSCEMVFCYQNYSDVLWEKIVLVIEKNLKIFCDH